VSIRDEEYADWLGEAEGEDGEGYGAGDEPGPGDILRGALREDFTDADPEALDDAVGQMLDAMSAAEGFNFAQALQQIGRTATKALSDPTVNSVLRTAVPLAAGAAGTLIGGPLGTAVGSGLGNALVGALPPVAGARPGPPAAPGTPSTAGAAPGTALASQLAGGSAAAAQGLVLTQQPEVLKALLSLAVGQAGRPVVNGVPVPQIMNLLSDVFGRAAAHADELMYTAPEQYGEAADEVGAPSPHALYTAFMDANAMELADAIDEGAL
jgi:hypothetical protein